MWRADAARRTRCDGCLMPLDLTRIRALCFDVDGTLSDTDDIFVELIAASLTPWKALWSSLDTRRAARRLVMLAEAPGNALLSLPDWLGLDQQVTSLINFAVHVLPPRQHHFRLVPGVREMLPQLGKQYPLSVVSARDERSTRFFLDQYQLTPHFTTVVTALTAEHTKPYPDPVLFAAERMGVPPAACLMIGDTTVDIRAGKAAGAQTVGVLCGFGAESELRYRGADLILETTAQVGEVLLGKG
jgi:HAD superfamily hydrolase (TIGR01509 family)